MTDGPTRCGRTEGTSITDRQIPRSWSKTDSVPKRTSDLEHGQRASLETGRGWRAESARHGRKPPPDARRTRGASRFPSETAIPEPGGAASRDPNIIQNNREVKLSRKETALSILPRFHSSQYVLLRGPAGRRGLISASGASTIPRARSALAWRVIDKPEAPAKSLSNPGTTSP
jgi:hypothetical protein